ncbi:hypothetical protein HF086_013673 [Spodoptera exigua]|uniref:Uncharacterized protein n=1 Tax=Spodoptera exigua TaxID=7107 RepID=A0A922MKS2_SPOEX|nr:hypothetical protein HF086_013673 [Spodoptera exigua]
MTMTICLHDYVCIVYVSITGESRSLQVEGAVFERAAELLRHSPEFTVLASLRQEPANSGTILSFSHGYNSGSGWRPRDSGVAVSGEWRGRAAAEAPLRTVSSRSQHRCAHACLRLARRHACAPLGENHVSWNVLCLGMSSSIHPLT